MIDSRMARIWQLGVTLFKRDLQAQFREAFLGFFWLFLPILAITGSFLIANQASLISTDNTEIPYPAYLIISITLWQLFAESLASPVLAIDKAKKIVVRIQVPPESFILAQLLEVWTYFLIKLVLVTVAIIYFGVSINSHVLLFPLGCIFLSLLGLCLGLVLTPFSILYRDVQKSLPIVTNFWMFLTPVVYPQSEVGVLKTLSVYNPVTSLLVSTRDAVTAGTFEYLYRGCVIAGLTLLGLFIAVRFFKFSWPTVIERMGG